MHPRHIARLLGFIGLALLASPLAASAGSAAADVVVDFGNRTFAALGDPQLTQAQRERSFATFLDEDFDFARISRIALGRYWQMATAEERQQFAATFRDYVVQSYSAMFSRYGGETFSVTGDHVEGETSTIVKTEISGPHSPTKVDWRVTLSDNGYKITDVSVDGISMAMTQREQVAAIMQRSTGKIADLIAQFRAKSASSVARQ